MPVSSQPRIIILTGASCPWCGKVKDYLREKKFRFTLEHKQRRRNE